MVNNMRFSFPPRTLSARIIWLIIFILCANLVLTLIFSNEYSKKQEIKGTIQGVRAIVTYLSVTDSLVGMDDIIEDYHVQVHNKPPEGLIPAQSTLLNSHADRFNHKHSDKIYFYQDPNSWSYIWLYYEDAKDGSEAWLAIPNESNINEPSYFIFAQEFIIVLMILSGSILTAFSIRKPLATIREATHQFGRGKLPEKLNIQSPEEVKQLAEAFNKMVDDVKAFEKERQMMLAGISHDLRTPLTRLQLMIDLSSQLSDETKRDMKSDIAQITAMQQQFIDYVSAGNHESFMHVDLISLVTQVAGRFDAELPMPIQFEFNCNKLMMDVQPTNMSRVINNLIVNAIKYGAPPIKIKIEALKSEVFLIIEDKGAGVPHAHLDEIFKPMFRGDYSRSNVEGSGLGLAIVKRIILKHAGNITAENVDDSFRIVITLPRMQKSV
jgi:two-component system osmolarity sensor histidine kinase EnvZ